MSKNHLLFLFPFLRSFYRAALSKVLESPPPPLPPPPPPTTTTASSDWRRTVEERVGEESREEGKEGEKVTVEGSTWEGRGGEGRKVSRKESSNKEIPGVAGELLAMMSGDWDKSVVGDRGVLACPSPCQVQLHTRRTLPVLAQCSSVVHGWVCVQWNPMSPLPLQCTLWGLTSSQLYNGHCQKLMGLLM